MIVSDWAHTMRMRLTNAENTMTSLKIITFNQLDLKPLVCMARPLPFFELPYKRTSWHVGWSQGLTVAPPAVVSGCGQGERCQYNTGLMQVWSCFSHPQCINNQSCSLMPTTCLLSMNSYCLPNICVFCKLWFIVFCMFFAFTRDLQGLCSIVPTSPSFLANLTTT